MSYQKIFFLAILFTINSLSHATIRYVNHNASGSNNGTSWTNAYTALQDAITASSAGDEIWVAEGTYKPNTIVPFTTPSTDNRNKGYSINKNIEIYGGFDGTETQRSQRDYRSNITILSGDIGIAGSVSDNCYHVIMTANLNSTAVIDGFTIQDGNSNGGNGTNQFGGRNFSKDLGGGIANNQSSPTLSNLIIKNNRGKNGAGISNRASSSTLVNLIVADNIATLNGGGVANMVSGTPSIINCVFSGNLADDFGGGIYSENSPTITNCSFFDNTTTTNTKGGGGIYAKNAGTSTVANCIFYENKIGSSKTNIHADIKASSNHTTNMSYSIVQLASSSYTLANSNALSSTSNMVYSGNPLFINTSDPDGGDNTWMTKDDGLKLKSTSPAVDAGLNSAISGYSADIVGTTRIVNTTLNMGAYELLACQQGNALPSSAATYTATYADTDGNYTCYCDDNSKLILGLNLTGTGAAVPNTGVSLQIGATTTTTYNSAGGIITNTDGGVVFNRKWNVSPTTQPTSDVTVLYPFTNTEYSAIQTALSSKGTTLSNANELQMFKLTSAGTFADPHANGATGIILTHGSSATTGNWVHSTHSNGTDHLATFKVSSFSGGGGGGGASNAALPVDLIHFDVHAANNHSASLHWATASEINNSHFEIERSYDGRAFEMIDQIAGNGNSQHQIEYNYIDEGVHSFENIAFYRLKQVDFDGTSEYSDIRVVRFDAVGSGIDFSAYPNPLTNELSVMVSLSNGEAYQIEITDLQGAKVHHKNHTFTNSIHKLNTSEWDSGMYILQVATDQGRKFVKVMKK